MHELGHHAEWIDKEIYEASRTWRDARGRQAHGRLEAKSLRELTKQRVYRACETAVPDHFFDAYVGKIYPYPTTEVFTMGIESFRSPKEMLRLYEQDPEHFLLVAGMLYR